MRVTAALIVFAASICTWLVAFAYLAASGFTFGFGVASMVVHPGLGHAAEGIGSTLFVWSFVVFAAALAQLIVALRLVRARTGALTATAAAVAFGICCLIFIFLHHSDRSSGSIQRVSWVHSSPTPPRSCLLHVAGRADMDILAGPASATRAIFRRVIEFVVPKKPLSMLNDAVSAEKKGDARQLKIRIGRWFSWNVSVNESHGTAGGSMKVSFPWSSSLATAAVCILVALAASRITRFIVSGVFACFALHHVRSWRRTLNVARSFAIARDRLRRVLPESDE